MEKAPQEVVEVALAVVEVVADLVELPVVQEHSLRRVNQDLLLLSTMAIPDLQVEHADQDIQEEVVVGLILQVEPMVIVLAEMVVLAPVPT